jgi:uncharacterized membrane protein YidH (DUF202 family)
MPGIALAQFNAAPIGGYMSSLTSFINGYIIPFIIAASLVVFMWGMFQFFVLGATNEEKREKGKQLAIWAVIGLVLMLSLQGIVVLLSSTLGFGDATIPAPSTPKL